MLKDYLWQKLGTLVQQGLQDENIVEVMLNQDGKLWFKHRVEGNKAIGHVYSDEALSFVHALAQSQQKYLNDKTPFLDTVLPFSGERINITIPPISEQICFNIRKHSKNVITLPSYVKAGIISMSQATLLSHAVQKRKNILISGSPGAGKTTFANALLNVIAEQANPGERVLILEQVPELQCNVPNIKKMLVSEHVSMNKLLWIAMRNAPERIIIGEVRDGSALDMLKAWNTGCPGGIATIHANNSQAAIQRVLDLACEVIPTPPHTLAAEALDIIVQITACSKHVAGRRITEMIAVEGYDLATKQFNCRPLVNLT
jgi:type IV secretion system protein TrbB